MHVDRKAFDRLFEESFDDCDLAENFGFFVEDYVLFDDDSHERYVEALRELPPLIRRLYLAFIAQIAVQGDGFQTYFSQIDKEDLMDETVTGLRLLSRDAAADAYERARNYPAFRTTDSRVSIVEPTSSEIHSAYFGAFGDDFWGDLGRHLREHRGTALNTRR